MRKPENLRRRLSLPTAGATLLGATLLGTSLLGTSSARADERVVSRSVKALETLCISTGLDERNLDAQVRAFVHKRLAREDLAKMSPDNEAGYAVIVDRSAITVTLGRKTSEREISRNCTVTIKDLAFADAGKLLQANYSAEELERFTYGLSEIAVYRAALQGYAADMFFSVQSGAGLTALSFFETPSSETGSAETPSAETPSANAR